MTPPPVCALCGTPATSRFQMPRAEGAPDLDLRPGEPARSTLPHWIRVCGGCGAAAPDLTALPGDAATIVASTVYTACPGAAETRPFRRWALLSPLNAPSALLHAAWAADDAGLTGEAAALRREAAALWAGVTDPERACLRLDALRRAGDFHDAARWLDTISPWANDEGTAAILAFQRARIAARDSGRYLLSAALRPPAHAPHVSHGKRARGGGLLSRWFGW